MNRAEPGNNVLLTRKRVDNPMDLFKGGIVQIEKGNFKDAQSKFRLALLYNPRLASKISLCYEYVLEADPENINARLALTDLHLSLGELEGAMGELEELIDIAPSRPDVYTILGKLYIKQQDFDKAIEVIELALTSGVKDIGLSEMLAGAYVEKGRINDAIELYKGLLLQDGDNKKYNRVLGELYARIKDYDEAAKAYLMMLERDTSMISEVIYKLEEIEKKAPVNVMIKQTLAEAYMKAIKPVKAVDELIKVLDLNPEKLDQVISSYRRILDKYPDEPTTIKALGSALTAKQSYSEAVSEYMRLIKYGNEHIEEAVFGFKDILSKFPGQVHAHESLGDAYVKAGKVEEALLEYLEVLKLDHSAAKPIIDKCSKISKEDPNMILVHQVMGHAYILMNDPLKAITEAEFMIYLDKNNASAHQIMGDAYMKQNAFNKAQAAYASAMQIEPYNTDIHNNYGASCAEVLKADVEVYKKRVDEDPWRLGTHLDLAKLYLYLRDFDKGVKELQTAVKDSARAPFAYNLLGLTFVEMGRFDLAAIQFERALETLPKELNDLSKSVRLNLGAAYEAMGNVPAALGLYEAIMTEDVDFGALQARSRRLASINPDSLRNKLIAVVIEKMNENSMIGMWGADIRHGEPSQDVLNISFGQDHNNAGFEHYIKGRLKGAGEEFSLAVQLDPKFCPSLNNLAVMYMRDDHMEQAQTRLTHALSLDPDSAVIRNNLGVFHYLKKNYDAAVIELTKALEIDPSLSAAYLNLGDVMYMRGNAQNAISMWEKIKTNDPLSPIAIRRLSYKTIKT
jgi:tetratricopeptide (TPR) repeat protein